MRFIFFMLLILSATHPLFSWAKPCSVREAANNVEIADFKHSARIAKSAIALNKKMLEIIPRNDGKTPIGKLLSPDQAEQFGQLRNQMLVFDFDELIESELARDAEAIAIMYSAAKAEQESTTRAVSNEKAPLALYDAMRSDPSMKPNIRVPQTPPMGCSLDDALAGDIFDAQQHIDAFPAAILQASQSTTSSLKKKYGSIDASKMSSEDKDAFEASLNAVAPALRNLMFERNLQNIRDFWAVAQEIHNDRIVDLRENGVDANVIGQTEEADFSKRTPRDQMLFQAWHWLNKEMPSEKERELKERAQEMDQINKISSHK
ncbi:hypothetical protein [Gluconobacter oxydans]|uniref:hypothetical protein n=1 Tax=Gluconobacter oxydans TaxID=442 RepID=UPI00062C896F|nr:hypothetical protein [Gluconobacter oxydans]